MKVTETRIRKIESESGYSLTQFNEVELPDRIIAKVIYLGKNDLPGNYKEIPDSEAEKIRQEIEEYLQNLEVK